jgi:hypothetical protein
MEESVREEWRDVKGYEGRYRVSNLGRVQSCTHLTGFQWHDMATPRNNRGYATTGFSKDGQSTSFLVHRLVAEAFCDGSGGDTVDHINGIRDDNRACNLEWVTMSENNLRSYRNGRVQPEQIGESNPNNKASEADVYDALACYANGEAATVISRRLGVNDCWLSDILRGKNWRCLNLDIGHYRQQHALSKQRAGNLRK